MIQTMLIQVCIDVIHETISSRSLSERGGEVEGVLQG